MVDAGGLVIEVLASKSGGPVAKADVDAWVGAYELPVTTLMDPPGTGTTTLEAFGIRETAVIVDLRTMKIVKKVNGSTLGTGESSVAQLLPELLSLLGK